MLERIKQIIIKAWNEMGEEYTKKRKIKFCDVLPNNYDEFYFYVVIEEYKKYFYVNTYEIDPSDVCRNAEKRFCLLLNECKPTEEQIGIVIGFENEFGGRSYYTEFDYYIWK